MMSHQRGPDTPASARVYDYWADGKDHYRPDRELADRLTEICPGAPLMARDSREFTGRAVAWAAKEGAAQFLDLGCGYPLGTGIHDIARAVNPAAAVAYVDIDEDVAAYASWVFTEDRKLKGVTATRADLRDPAAVLGHPGVRKVIDTGQPVCVIAAMVLHFMPSAEADHYWHDFRMGCA
jgi:SAM-dependent methyltransferase